MLRGLSLMSARAGRGPFAAAPAPLRGGRGRAGADGAADEGEDAAGAAARSEGEGRPGSEQRQPIMASTGPRPARMCPPPPRASAMTASVQS